MHIEIAYESLFSIDPLLHALTIVYLKFNLQENYVYNHIMFRVIKMKHVEIYIIHNMSSFYIFCSKICKYIYFIFANFSSFCGHTRLHNVRAFFRLSFAATTRGSHKPMTSSFNTDQTTENGEK